MDYKYKRVNNVITYLNRFQVAPQGSLKKLQQGGGASMRRSLLKAKLKLSRFTSLIILFKSWLRARRALSNPHTTRQSQKSKQAKFLQRCYRAGGLNGDEGEREKAEERDRWRRRRVRERSCGDGVCAQCWQTS
eukprot:3054967-Pleurochrysis_carterae.AAC.1